MADRDYNIRLTTDLILNDFDDERTLDEEEALEENEDSTNELSNLQKEGHMPLNELLAKYGYGDSLMENSNSSDQMNEECNNEEEGERAAKTGNEGDAEDDEEEEEDEEEEDEEDEEEDDLSNTESSLKKFYADMVKDDKMKGKSGPVSTLNRKVSKEEKSELAENECSEETFAESEVSRNEDNATSGKNNNENSENLCPDGETNEENRCCTSGTGCGGNGTTTGGSSRLLRSVSRPQSEEEEDDCDYSPDEEEWKKTIMVGSDYQAAIPEGLCRYDDALPYENEDKMLWDPSHIPQEQTEEFLERAQLPVVRGTTLPSGSHVRDDEQALYLLLQCGYNLEEALRRRRMNVLPPTDAVSLWSEEECHNFESGLRNYGKDFHLIQKNKVRTRSVGELVQFYYLWKKSERHDIFTYKARLEKKKYALHPGITDYMDRFLEEQEGVRDRSSSPNVHCLLYGDSKRQKTSTGMNNADDSKSLESWDNNNPGNNAADAAPESVAVKEESPESATETNVQAKNSILQTSSVHNSTNANVTRGHVDYASHLMRENNEAVAKTTTGEPTVTTGSWTSGTTSQQCNNGNNNFPTTTSSETYSRTPDNVTSLIPP